jgi:hypothetical protein
VAMFRKIATETAMRLKYRYPEEVEKYMADWIESRFKE